MEYSRLKCVLFLSFTYSCILVKGVYKLSTRKVGLHLQEILKYQATATMRKSLHIMAEANHK
jgi:hypothetical protein